MGRKRLNKNVVVGVSLFAFFAMIVLSTLMLRELRKGDPQHFIEFATRYEAEGEWKQAAVFYNRALNKTQDPVHLVSIGRMLLNDGDVAGALQAWRQALVNRPDLVEAHMRQIELLLELARLYGRVPEWLEVQRTAEAFLDSNAERTPAETAAARHALGLALVNLPGQDADNEARGLEALRKAAELEEGSVDYAVDLAMRLVAQGDPDEGSRRLRDLVEAHPEPGTNASKARLAYARFLAGRDQEDEATAVYKDAIAMAEGAPDALNDARLGLAAFLSGRWARTIRPAAQEAHQSSMFDEAESLLKKAIDDQPSAFEAYLQLSMLYKAAERHEDVVRICAERLEQGLSRKGVEAHRDRYHAFQLMLNASEACVALAEENRDDRAARAQWLDQAESYVDRAGGEIPRHPHRFRQIGLLRKARGEDRAALDAFRDADEGYRAQNLIDWRTKLEMARLHLQLNEPGAARDVLGEVADQASSESFWTLYALALFRTDDLDRAMMLVDQVLQADPDSADARRIKAAIFERRGMADRAARLADTPSVRAMLEARERILEGDHEEAAQLLLEAVKEDPADPRLVRATVGELLVLDRADEARAVVDAALAVEPEDVFLQKLRVLVRPDLSAEERDAELLEIIRNEPDGYQRGWDLVDYHARRNDLKEVLAALDQAEAHLIARDTPLAQDATTDQYLGLLRVKLRAAAEANDDEAMDEARAAAVKHDVDGAGGQTIVGMYHFYRDEIDPAIGAFRAALNAQPTNARAMTRLGQCLLRTARWDEARLLFEQAVRIHPNERDAHRGLGMLAKQRGDMETYRRHLEICQRLIPQDPWVLQEVLAQQEESAPRAAIERREALLAASPDDEANLVRLAVLCEKVGENAKAETYYKRLLESRPTDKNLLAGVAQFYRGTNRPDEALALVTRFADAQSGAEAQADARILIAAHHVSEGDFHAVEKVLLDAAALATTVEVAHALGEFYLRSVDRPADALIWYDKAADAARADSSPRLPAILGARIACAMHRDVDDLELARRYVDELVNSFPDDPQGSFWQSEVLAREGRIDEAIGALSAYLAQNPSHPYSLFQRAQHYLAQGRTGQAIDDLQAVKRVDPLALDLKPRLLLARIHEQAGRRDAALAELESIVTDAPTNAAPYEALINAYLRADRLDDADRLVTSQINRTADDPDAQWFRLRGRVSLLLGDVSKALADLQRAAELQSYSAVSVMHVLDVFLRTRRFAEGLAWSEQNVSADQTTPAVTARTARLLAGEGRTDDVMKRFRLAMTEAMAGSVSDVAAVTAEIQALYGGGKEAAEQAITLFSDDRLEADAARANDRILVRLYRLADRPGDASETLGRLVRTAGRDAERAQLLLEQAEMLQAIGEPEQARAACEAALEYDRDNWIALNNLAYLLAEELGEWEEALPYAKRAVAISDVSQTLDTLGWTYVGLGQYPLAVAELSRAVRLDPGAAASYYHLGEAYRRWGQFDEARRVLAEARALAEGDTMASLREQIEASFEKAARSDHTL